MLTIFSDGGARGNPGPASCAFGVYDENKELIYSDARYLGITTNNVAEYNGVIFALTGVMNYAPTKLDGEIIFNLDSELVVNQLTGIYKIKNKTLESLALRVKKIIVDNNLHINFVHIPRRENFYADKLVNEKLDESSRL